MLVAFATYLLATAAFAQDKPTEDDYYRMVTFPIPDDITLEVGGLGWLDAEQTRLLACTRRGELYVIDNVYAEQLALAGQKLKD